MPSATLPLSALAQQLARKQSELDKLRRSYDTRLADLLRRKEALEASLRQVDTEIQVASQGPAPSLPAPPPAAPTGHLSLPNLLVAIVREKGKPVTIGELVDELTRRSYSTNSANLSKMVSNRLHDLIAKKMLSRIGKGRGKGFVLGRSGEASSSPKQAVTTSAAHTNGAPAKKATLPVLIEALLAKSNGPVRAVELANRVIKAGYKTKSKTPVDLIWAAVSKMNNVENVRGKGYRLKK